jgi:hypothetical protein
MVQFSRLKFLAAASAFSMLGAVAAPALADDLLTNLGPVGPSEPILVKVGNQRMIAFFVPERGNCSLSAVSWKEAGPDAPFASERVRISLKPGQLVQLDGAQRQPLGLLCGADASSLAVTASPELILTGATGSRQ